MGLRVSIFSYSFCHWDFIKLFGPIYRLRLRRVCLSGLNGMPKSVVQNGSSTPGK